MMLYETGTRKESVGGLQTQQSDDIMQMTGRIWKILATNETWKSIYDDECTDSSYPNLGQVISSTYLVSRLEPAFIESFYRLTVHITFYSSYRKNPCLFF